MSVDYNAVLDDLKARRAYLDTAIRGIETALRMDQLIAAKAGTDRGEVLIGGEGIGWSVLREPLETL